MPFRAGPSGRPVVLDRPSGRSPVGGGDLPGTGADFVPSPANTPPGHQWVRGPSDLPGGAADWRLIKLPAGSDPASAAATAAGLNEQIRSNRAREALATRQLALDQALGALSAFSTAQTAADTRRATAFSEARTLSGLLVPQGTEFFPGLGPESGLAQVSGNLGLDFEAPSVVERQFQPQALDQPGPIPQQVQQMIAGLGAV